MPELPEVEAIKQQLDKFLHGHSIKSIIFHYRKRFEGDEQKILETKIVDTRRFGKVVVIDFENGYSLLTHVKMTGQFVYRGPNLANPKELSKKIVGGVPGKHTHIIFKLDKGGILYFNDIRKFGWMKVVSTSEVEKDKFIGNLGPEPFKDLTLEIFAKILSKSAKPVKLVIMDQTKMGGVGNIYANDALWLAGISPRRSAASLSSSEVGRLYDAILSVLKEGIRWGGASELAFVTPDGTEGEYQGHTLAYGHTGEPCERCHKGVFEKYFLGGRGTYICPNCQK